MTALEVATYIGTGMGAAMASYLALRHTLQRRQAPHQEPPPALPPARAPQPSAHDDRISALPAESALTEQQIRTIVNQAVDARLDLIYHTYDAKLREFLTVEEFTAYANQDQQRREALVEKVGELRGTVAALKNRL